MRTDISCKDDDIVLSVSLETVSGSSIDWNLDQNPRELTRNAAVPVIRRAFAKLETSPFLNLTTGEKKQGSTRSYSIGLDFAWF